MVEWAVDTYLLRFGRKPTHLWCNHVDFKFLSQNPVLISFFRYVRRSGGQQSPLTLGELAKALDVDEVVLCSKQAKPIVGNMPAALWG